MFLHFHPVPPHLHLVPVILTAALAGAGALYMFGKGRAAAAASGLAGRFEQRAGRWRARAGCGSTADQVWSTGSTGNAAFDAYKADKLKAFEAEAAEFRAYLDGLRRTNDKAEFEEFLQSRKDRGAGTETNTG